jgi:hypothetical protein
MEQYGGLTVEPVNRLGATPPPAKRRRRSLGEMVNGDNPLADRVNGNDASKLSVSAFNSSI